MDGLLIFALVIGVPIYLLYRLYVFALRRGAEMATSEMCIGVGDYCNNRAGKVPDELKSLLKKRIPRGGWDNFQTLLGHTRSLGEQVAFACWQKGCEDQAVDDEPRDGSVRVDFTTKELHDIWWLAHIGFQRATAPNERSPYGYARKEDAEAGQHAIERLEREMPKDWRDPNDPYAHSFNRQTMIWDRWPSGTPDLT